MNIHILASVLNGVFIVSCYKRSYTTQLVKSNCHSNVLKLYVCLRVIILLIDVDCTI